jgi:hypothetical protein
MRVRMLQTRHVKKDHFHEYRYDVGKSFYLPTALAQQYIEQGIAMEDKSIDVTETKKKRKRKTS